MSRSASLKAEHHGESGSRLQRLLAEFRAKDGEMTAGSAVLAHLKKSPHNAMTATTFQADRSQQATSIIKAVASP